jgi:hypothetical protein
MYTEVLTVTGSRRPSRPLPVPISPNTASNILGLPDVDNESMFSIAQGLIATVKKREADHQAALQRI